MVRAARILEGAKTDFAAIKRYVIASFGADKWRQVNEEFRAAVQAVAGNPLLGQKIDELAGYAAPQFRKYLVGQTWIVYEYGDEHLFVHIFLSTRQDFESHLLARLLGA